MLQLDSNLQSSCLKSGVAEITCVCHCARLTSNFKIHNRKEKKRKKKAQSPFLQECISPKTVGMRHRGRGTGENPELPAQAAIVHTLYQDDQRCPDFQQPHPQDDPSPPENAWAARRDSSTWWPNPAGPSPEHQLKDCICCHSEVSLKTSTMVQEPPGGHCGQHTQLPVACTLASPLSFFTCTN